MSAAGRVNRKESSITALQSLPMVQPDPSCYRSTALSNWSSMSGDSIHHKEDNKILGGDTKVWVFTCLWFLRCG